MRFVHVLEKCSSDSQTARERRKNESNMKEDAYADIFLQWLIRDLPADYNLQLCVANARDSIDNQKTSRRNFGGKKLILWDTELQ